MECWNQGNLALIEELLAPDFIHHNPDRPDVRSREDYKRWFAESHRLFPDFHITVEVVSLKPTKWRDAGSLAAPIQVISSYQHPLLQLARAGGRGGTSHLHRGDIPGPVTTGSPKHPPA